MEEPLTEDVRFRLLETVDEVARAYLDHQIKRFNDAVSPNHRAIRPTGKRTLDVLVHDDRGDLVGGLIGRTYWGWLEVEDLWLHERLRGQGIGRKLMQVAEHEAQARGCRQAMVRTFSFQALGFYERLGYRVVGQLEDYPPGENFYWLRKDF